MSEQRLTRRQAAIVGAFTGINVGPFGDMQELAEELLGRSIFTHEFANSAVVKELKEAARPLFIAIAATDDDSV